MLEKFVEAIKTSAKPEKITANGLEYVLQNNSYILAEDPELNKVKNALKIEEKKVENELSILNYQESIQSKTLDLEFQKALHPIKTEVEKLQYELKQMELEAKLENEDLIVETMKTKANIEAEQAKNQLKEMKPARQETFSSIKSFVEFVLHESKNNNKTGVDYFILLNSSGGKFYTNFDRIKDVFVYKRSFSEVYKRLVGASQQRTVNQKMLLEFILENKNYISGFAEVFNSFKKVKNTKTSKFETEPIISSDSEETIEVVQTWEFNGELKKEKITLIPELEITIPIIHMGEAKYKMNIYITPIKGSEGQILFDIYAPGIEYVLQTALNDELDYTKEALKSLTDAFIGLDC